MKNIRYAFIGLALLLLPACGTGSGVCETDTDCPANEQCLWMKRAGQVVGKRCTLKCSSDADCGGTTCSATASSCPACTDNMRICAE